MYFQALAQFTQYETDNYWRRGASETDIEEASSEGELFENFENASIASEMKLRTCFKGTSSEASEKYVEPRDFWYHVAESSGTLGDIQCVGPGVSSVKSRNYSLSKCHKGTFKKKLRFNFRAMNKASGMQDSVENQKVSLAHQLHMLTRSDGSHLSKSNLPSGLKQTASRVGLSMSEQFCELVQRGSKVCCSKKALTNRDCQKLTHALQTAGNSKVSDRGDNFNDCQERENDAGVASSLDVKLPTKSMNEQFQRALLSASGSIEDSNRHSKVKGFGFTAHLQQVLEQERLERIHFLKTLHMGYKFQDRTNCLEVEILTKSLEARLSTCVCKVVKSPKSWIVQANETGRDSYPMVMVIFNMQTNAYLELEIGRLVCIHRPWRELSHIGEFSKTILCTYFSEFSITP